MKKVTILIPCYNGEKYIARCLDSCVNQTYKNLQILVVNDGSNDNSINIINSYLYKFDNIELINQNNKGLAKTRNILLNNIKTEYGIFLDADDWLEKDCISFFMNNLNNEKLIINSCFISTNKKSKSFYITNKINNKTTNETFLINNTVFAWNILFEVRYIKENNFYFYDEFSFFEDAGVMSYLIYKTKNKEIKFLNNPKYHYFINKQSLSRNKISKEKIISSLKQLEHFYKLIKQEQFVNFPKCINDQLAFYHCIIFTYIQFQSKLDSKNKKELKVQLKSLEKNNKKIKFPKRYWKFWYFVLYRMFFY